MGFALAPWRRWSRFVLAGGAGSGATQDYRCQSLCVSGTCRETLRRSREQRREPCRRSQRARARRRHGDGPSHRLHLRGRQERFAEICDGGRRSHADRPFRSADHHPQSVHQLHLWPRRDRAQSLCSWKAQPACRSPFRFMRERRKSRRSSISTARKPSLRSDAVSPSQWAGANDGAALSRRGKGCWSRAGTGQENTTISCQAGWGLVLFSRKIDKSGWRFPASDLTRHFDADDRNMTC